MVAPPGLEPLCGNKIGENGTDSDSLSLSCFVKHTMCEYVESIFKYAPLVRI